MGFYINELTIRKIKKQIQEDVEWPICGLPKRLDIISCMKKGSFFVITFNIDYVQYRLCFHYL